MFDPGRGCGLRDRVFSSPAQIACFDEAVNDRLNWIQGTAVEQELEEPGQATEIRRKMSERKVNAIWWEGL